MKRKRKDLTYLIGSEKSGPDETGGWPADKLQPTCCEKCAKPCSQRRLSDEMPKASKPRIKRKTDE